MDVLIPFTTPLVHPPPRFMTDWTDGYVADISYDYNFFPELAPITISFNLLDNGFLPPSLDRFTYCELGCGQGFTTNVLAATNPQGDFWGMDFNPTHVAAAQRLAAAAQLKNIHFSDHSFAEFLAADTPDFDFIALHGVYAWISDENRRAIGQLLRRKLKVGGVVYISYNTLPGWAPLLPLRELMVQYTRGSAEASTQKVEKGLAFAQHLHELKATYFRDNPIVKYNLEEMVEDSRNYLAHEYFNHDFHPFYHSEVAQHLMDAKLTFATSADLEEQFDNLKLDANQVTLLQETPDVTLRETIRDFLLNCRFRRDLFVKGPVKLPALEQAELLSTIRFVLLVPPEEISYEITLGEHPIKLDEHIYDPLVAALADRPQTLREIMKQPPLSQLDFAAILQALKILMVMGWVSPALPAANDDDRKPTIAAFNQAVLKQARFGADTPVLASPITGSGIDIDRSEQLFLLAHLRQVDLVAFTWNILQAQGERLIKDGKILASPKANQAELRQQADEFMRVRLPELERLGLV